MMAELSCVLAAGTAYDMAEQQHVPLPGISRLHVASTDSMLVCNCH